MHLTDTEIKDFHHLGYVVKKAVFSDADLHPVRQALNEIVDAKAPHIQALGLFRNLYAGSSFETRLVDIQNKICNAANSIIHHILGKAGDGYNGSTMLGMLQHKPLLGCIESLLGPDIVGSPVYRLRPKLPNWQRGEVPESKMQISKFILKLQRRSDV